MFRGIIMTGTVIVLMLLLLLLLAAVPGLLGLALPVGAMMASMALLAKIVAPFQPDDDEDEG